MEYDKAYKLVAKQEKISHSKAKELIDKGLVYVGNKKVQIARGEIGVDTSFNVKEISKIKVLFEDKSAADAVNELMQRMKKDELGVELWDDEK